MELTTPLQISEAATIEYLRKPLLEDLQYLLKGAQKREVAWARLGEKFDDKVGQVRWIMKNLYDVDLTKGKTYEKIEKLSFEISQMKTPY